MRNKIIFLQSHLNWFIPFISELYPLTKFQLLQYEEILDWSRIKANPFIRWDRNMVNTFLEKLDTVERIPPSGIEIISCEFGEFLPARIIFGYPDAENVFLRPQEQTRSDQLNWKDMPFGLYEKQLYAEDDIMLLIKKFDCKIQIGTDPFVDLHIPTQYLAENKELMDWEYLSGYWGLNWSFELLQEFEQYWITDKLIENHTVFNSCLKNDLNDDFIEKVIAG